MNDVNRLEIKLQGTQPVPPVDETEDIYPGFPLY